MKARFLLTLTLTAAAFAQQTTPPAKTTTPPAPSPTNKTAKTPSAKPGAELAPNTPVITLNGLCSAPAKAAGCRTVITKAQFDRLLEALGPRAQMGDKQRIAEIYYRSLVLENQAQKMGLDKKDPAATRLKLSRMQILAQAAAESIADNTKPSDAEIAAYYKAHPNEFEKLQLTRVVIPRKPEEAATDKAKTEDAAEKQYAQSILDRAKKGEDPDKLEEEAFTKAGLKAKPPTTKPVDVRRGQLPEDQEDAVFALNKGEYSPLYEMPGAFVFYKVVDKSKQTLEDAKPEIMEGVTRDKTDKAMNQLFNAVKPTFNPAYFTPPPPEQPETPPTPPAPPTPAPTPTPTTPPATTTPTTPPAPTTTPTPPPATTTTPPPPSSTTTTPPSKPPQY